VSSVTIDDLRAHDHANGAATPLCEHGIRGSGRPGTLKVMPSSRDRAPESAAPDTKRAAFESVLAGACEGAGGALVLRSAAGAGKTSLLQYAAACAPDLGVAHVTGVESEAGLAFAALHQLLLPFLPGLSGLPAPQRNALGTAFGLTAGTTSPDRFLVGLAVLGLFDGAAAARPLLVIVDDVQWLDEATTEVLGVVARRLRTTSVTLTLAVREPAPQLRPFDGLPCLCLAPPPEPGEQTDAGLDDGTPLASYAMIVLELGLGRYGSAFARALKVYREDPPDVGTLILPDLIEAAARCGNREAALLALQRLSERTDRAADALAEGLLARSRALLATDEAEELYRSAIALLHQSGAEAHVARAHLLYGEWLRRRRQRREARDHLRAAHQLFDDLGLAAFARRADIELGATAEHVGKRAEVRDRLTAQEAEITRLVVEGASNRQVAAELFISRNTVEYHLQKVFRKIGVRSRTQLARVILNGASTDQPAGFLIGRPSSAELLARS
jgi:DNA-binding CsgD family transcriptional regulator